ncbi:MAG: HEAT repeat domain-containing protein [Candidatus Omnitrophica bacterium]|nr:HEAT repeat domain-containing protein [Candidatus Omnitrophota bacterium]
MIRSRPYRYTFLLIAVSFLLGIISPTPTYAEVPPRQLKNNALQKLKVAETGDDKIDKKLDKVVEHLEKSLEAYLWLDDWHLSADMKAKKVFDEEASAVKYMLSEIRKSANKKIIPEELESLFEELIVDLLEADILLAKTTLDIARVYIDIDKKVDKHIRKAEDMFNEGHKKQAEGKPDSAIKKFMKAWKHARDALKFVTHKIVAEAGDKWIDAMEEAFSTESWDGIVASAYSLEKMGEPALPRLIEEFTDQTEYEIFRKMIAEIIAEIGGEDAIEPLIGVLQDETDAELVRAEAAYTLGRLGNIRALEPLKNALNSDETRLKSMAALGLGILEREEAIPALMPHLEDQDDMVRVRTGRALSQLGAEEAFDYFVELLNNDPNADIRALAALWLADLQDMRASGHLINSLEDEDEVIACNAATALGMLKNQTAVEPLITALGVEGLLKIYAAQALAEIGDQSAAASIIEAINTESSQRARERLIEAYEKLTGQKYQG